MRNEKKTSEAVARLVAKLSDYKTESQALGVPIRTLQRWVADQRKLLKLPPEEGDPAEKPAAAPDSAAVKAKKGAGLIPDDQGKPGAAPPTAAPDQAVLSMQRFVLDTVQNVTGGLTEAIVSFRYTPPLKTSDPRVREIMNLGPMEVGACTANAERLYPYCMKLMNGLGPWALAMTFGMANRWGALAGIAVQDGWKPKAGGPKPSTTEAAIAALPAPAPGPKPQHTVEPAAAAVERDRAAKVKAFSETMKPGAPIKPGGQILDVP